MKHSVRSIESVMQKLEDTIAEQELLSIYGGEMSYRKELQRRINELQSKLSAMQPRIPEYPRRKQA